jgi:hypothetical protein
MHLTDHRFHRPEERHESLRVSPHALEILHRVPGHVLHYLVGTIALGVMGKIVARAKGISCAGQNYHMYVSNGANFRTV